MIRFVFNHLKFKILKYIKLIVLIGLVYQTPTNTKSASFEKFDSRYLSNYFSGIVAYENKDNSNSLDFFRSSKILIDKHDPYLKRYIFSLVQENKITGAINLIKQNLRKENTDFFESYVLLVVDSIKKDNFDQAEKYLVKLSFLTEQNRFNLIIYETLRQYIYVFKEKRISFNDQNFGNLTLITNTFKRCYLGDINTEDFFLKLIDENNKFDYSRYLFFYLSYLIENNRIDEAIQLTNKIEYINNPILLSQGKNWIENKKYENFKKVFSCKNHKDLISEFLFLISNLYSSQDQFEKSNFYLNIANFLNPKFVFNLALVADNYYLNQNYEKAKETLKVFNKETLFYYWFRIKKEAQIIGKESDDVKALNYLVKEFSKFDNPNLRMILDVGNFHKSAKKYKKAISFYSTVLSSIDSNSELSSDILYRRGGSYERIKDFENSDKDLLASLEIDPDDAYVLNYLAYSWLERDYKIDEAISMLEKAYAIKSNDPYIIDSIGWAYYLIDDYVKAEKFLKRAVELMPDDPIVNDHYGDILWKLDRKIQARYFWSNVLSFEDTEEEMKEKINIKLISGPQNT